MHHAEKAAEAREDSVWGDVFIVGGGNNYRCTCIPIYEECWRMLAEIP